MDPERNETSAQKMDRNWSELLQELRVTQTGGQILSGFLLTLPFQARFTSLSHGQQGLYLAAVLLGSLSSGLLIAPVSAHRLLFRHHEKDVLVTTGDALAKAGLVCLSLTVTTVLALIFSVVASVGASIAVAIAAALFFALCWLLLPLLVQRRRGL
jgi:Flp pilus assembly protein TadB